MNKPHKIKVTEMKKYLRQQVKDSMLAQMWDDMTCFGRCLLPALYPLVVLAVLLTVPMLILLLPVFKIGDWLAAQDFWRHLRVFR